MRGRQSKVQVGPAAWGRRVTGAVGERAEREGAVRVSESDRSGQKWSESQIAKCKVVQTNSKSSRRQLVVVRSVLGNEVLTRRQGKRHIYRLRNLQAD
jgi:hypothetical protein